MPTYRIINIYEVTAETEPEARGTLARFRTDNVYRESQVHQRNSGKPCDIKVIDLSVTEIKEEISSNENKAVHNLLENGQGKHGS